MDGEDGIKLPKEPFQKIETKETPQGVKSSLFDGNRLNTHENKKQDREGQSDIGNPSSSEPLRHPCEIKEEVVTLEEEEEEDMSVFVQVGVETSSDLDVKPSFAQDEVLFPMQHFLEGMSGDDGDKPAEPQSSSKSERKFKNDEQLPQSPFGADPSPTPKGNNAKSRLLNKSNKNSHLEENQQISSGQRPFTCDVCNKNFATNYNLTRHSRSHSEDTNFMCHHCNKTFTDKSSLTLHIRIHSGERPFKCRHCNKSFVHTSHLKDHIKIHSGEKPFVCPHCNKGFRQSSTLTVHMRIHFGEKPCVCTVCNMSFTYISNLRRHMRTHKK